VAAVHRVFGTQAVEDVALDVVDKVLRVGRVQIGQRRGPDFFACGGLGG
jgi:hypothetical protein